MYPPPPFPYPPGYGYYGPPPPGPFRHSQTPAPHGSANKHARRASQQVPPGYFNNYSARVPPQYMDPRFGTNPYASPLRPEHVSSGFDPPRGETRYREPDFDYLRSGKQSRDDPRYRTSGRYNHGNVDYDDPYWDAMNRARLYEAYVKFARANRYSSHHQDREHRNQEPKTPRANQARPRRASMADPRPHGTSPKKSPKSPKHSPPKARTATEEDRRRAHIPAGFSLKNWDPSEEPITLLGSVFDANSLGKWIYDWTCYTYGNGAPMTDSAGDLWLLLIQLAGKTKRADEGIDHMRQEENRELVEDFLESGERLWVRFKKLLKACEEYMYRAAQRETGEKKPTKMGPNSGVEFTETMFGRDRELNSTEKLMANIRLWSMRFDANVDPILHDPEA